MYSCSTKTTLFLILALLSSMAAANQLSFFTIKPESVEAYKKAPIRAISDFASHRKVNPAVIEQLKQRADSLTTTDPVGSYSGVFSVSNIGGAEYTLPVLVAPGRQSMEPSISFSYNSMNRNDGLLGIGWTINGLNSIQRCGSSYRLNGQWGSLSYDNSDYACMNNQRLVLVKGEYWADRSEYRLEQDKLTRIIYFTSIEQGQRESYFQVENKDGRHISYYGSSTNLNTGFEKSAIINADYEVTAVWPISERRDKSGNYIIFEYHQEKRYCKDDISCRNAVDYVTKEFVPYRISYTGNHATGKKPNRYVEFIYERRPKIDASYRAGSLTLQTKRLSRIGSVGPDNFVFRTYEIEYKNHPISENSYINSIRECAGDGVCKPPVIFKWSATQSGVFDFSRTTIDGWGKQNYTSYALYDFHLLDLNGDGLNDIVYRYGMGLSQYLPTNFDTGRWYFRLNQSTNTKIKFSDEKVITEKDKDNTQWYWAEETPWPVRKLMEGKLIPKHQVFDREGDGQQELVSVKTSENDPRIRKDEALIEVNRFDGSSVISEIQKIRTTSLLANKASFIADFNGDGIVDIVLLSTKSDSSEGRIVNVTFLNYEKQAYSIENAFTVRVNPKVNLSDIQIVDEDGDGTPSLMSKNFRLSFSGIDKAIEFKYSANNRFGASELTAESMYLDLNGDGLTDMVAPENKGEYFDCYLNQGKAYARARGCGSFAELISNENASISSVDLGKDAVFYDFTGDGYKDLVLLERTLFKESEHTSGGGFPAAKKRWFEYDLKRRFFFFENRGFPNQKEFAGYVATKKPGAFHEIVNNFVSFQLDNQYIQRLGLANYFGDLNGDSLPDFIIPGNQFKFEVFINNSSGVEQIEEIWEGLSSHSCFELVGGAKNWIEKTDYSLCSKTAWLRPTYSIRYAQSVGNDTYTIDHKNTSDRQTMKATPEVDFYPAHDLVSEVEHFNVSNATSETVEKQYFGAKYDPLNRRYLGFKKITTINNSRNTKDVIVFENDVFDSAGRLFPYAFLVKSSESIAIGDDNKRFIDRIENAYEYRQQGIHHKTVLSKTTVSNVVQEVVDVVPIETLLGRVTTSFRYNSLDQQIHTRSHSLTGRSTETNISLLNDTANWCMSNPITVHSNENLGEKRKDSQYSFTYDAECRLKEFKNDKLKASEFLRTLYSYDEYGNVESIESVDSNQDKRGARFKYDSFDNSFMVEKLDQESHTIVSRIVHRTLGLPIVEVDQDGLATKYVYDRFGRIREQIIPNEVVVTSNYGFTARQKNSSKTVFHSVDTVRMVQSQLTGRSVRLIGEQGRLYERISDAYSPTKNKYRIQQFTYDYRGRLTKMYIPSYGEELLNSGNGFFTELMYDKVDRLVSVIKPNGVEVSYVYEDSDEKIAHKVIRSDGSWKEYEIDQDGLLIKVVSFDSKNSDRKVIKYEYSVDRRVQEIETINNVVRVEYDDLGRIVASEDNDRGRMEWFYNAFGEIKKIRKGNGAEHYFEYDNVGRLIERRDSDGVTTWQYGYPNCRSCVVKAKSPWGHTQLYEYDDYGRPTKNTVRTKSGESYSINYRYDLSGNVDSIEYPRNELGLSLSLIMSYDTFGNLKSVSDKKRNLILWKKRDEDAFGNTTNIELGNNVRIERDVSKSEGHVISEKVYRKGKLLEQHRYDWSAEGKLVGIVDEVRNLRKRFAYDGAGNLERVQKCSLFGGRGTCDSAFDEAFRYDRQGNVIWSKGVGVFAYEVERPNQLTKVGKKEYVYDDSGNLTEVGEKLIEYSAFDLPKIVRSGSEEISFSYDAYGNVLTRESNTERHLVFDDLFEVKEGLEERFVKFYVFAENQLIAIYTKVEGQNEKIEYLVNDHLGSKWIVLGRDGEVVQKIDYRAFGEPIEHKDVGLFGFTGHNHDESLEIIDMGGRIYDPKTGRFFTPEQVISDVTDYKQFGSYGYALNDPINVVDPTGLSPKERQEGTWTYRDVVEGCDRDACGEWTFAPPSVPQVVDAEDPPGPPNQFGRPTGRAGTGGGIFTFIRDPDMAAERYFRRWFLGRPMFPYNVLATPKYGQIGPYRTEEEAYVALQKFRGLSADLQRSIRHGRNALDRKTLRRMIWIYQEYLPKRIHNVKGLLQKLRYRNRPFYKKWGESISDSVIQSDYVRSGLKPPRWSIPIPVVGRIFRAVHANAQGKAFVAAHEVAEAMGEVLLVAAVRGRLVSNGWDSLKAIGGFTFYVNEGERIQYLQNLLMGSGNKESVLYLFGVDAGL